MASQPPKLSAIPFSLKQPFENVRLLELPDELLEIIEKTNVEPTDSLYLKSSPPIDNLDGNESQTKEGSLHLCTNDKSWLVKQVSTSNSVYVARTSLAFPVEDDDGDEPMDGLLGRIQTGLTAFAKPGNVLELHPIPSATYQAVAVEHLMQLVPTINRVKDIDLVGRKVHHSIQRLYDHIPAPRSAISKELAEQCVFEAADVGAYIPTANLMLDTWRKLIEAATIAGTKITASLDTDALLDSIPDVDDIADNGDAINICKNVAKRMFEHGGYLEALGIIVRSSNETNELDMLNEMEISRWVGNLILKAARQGGDGGKVEKDAFEKRWEDAVPAAWVRYCSAEVLDSACSIETGGEKTMIAWKEYSVISGSDGRSDSTQKSTAQTTVPLPAASVGKAKRKWHEKFATQRNVKR